MKNRIVILSLACLIFLVMACGNALASEYQYTNVEWTKLVSTSAPCISSYTSAYGSFAVHQGDVLKWQNTLENDVQNLNVNPAITWYVDAPGTSSGSDSGGSIGYHYVWAPDERSQAIQQNGGHLIYVKHKYSWPDWIILTRTETYNCDTKYYTYS